MSTLKMLIHSTPKLPTNTRLFLASLSIILSLPAAAEWQYATTADEMTGRSEGFVFTESVNSIKGWLHSGKVMLGFHCSGPSRGFYMRANDIGFTIDDIDCDSYSCKRTQYSRIKFDGAEPDMVKFNVWESNHDGMSLDNYVMRATLNFTDEIVDRFLQSTTVLIEVEAFNTDGRQQIARFTTADFASAYSQCSK